MMKLNLFLTIFMIHLFSDADAYEFKIVIPKGYSKPWVTISADGISKDKITEGRVHFHGWTQDQKTGRAYHPNYDFDWLDSNRSPSEVELKKFIEAYAIEKEVETNPYRMVLIPLARGHCDQYLELADDAIFDEVLSSVLHELGMNQDSFMVKAMSAHSGGGSVLSRLMQKSGMSPFLSKVTKVILFDAVYSTKSVDALYSWIMSGSSLAESKKLLLYSIPHLGPSSYADNLLSRFNSSETIVIQNINGLSMQQKSKSTSIGNSILVIEELKLPYQLNHWSLVTSMWGNEIKRRSLFQMNLQW